LKKQGFLFLIFCLILPCVFIFSACGKDELKLLSSPTDFSVEANGLITFKMVDKAEYYTVNINGAEFNINPSNDSANNKISKVNGYLKYDASSIFVLGDSYDVKVKACGYKYEDSSYTRTFLYTHAETMDVPKNVHMEGQTLTWEGGEKLASFYYVIVVAPFDKLEDDSPEAVASSGIEPQMVISNTFPISSVLREAGIYKFYVNAVSLNSNYLDSGYSEKVEYTHFVNLATPEKVDVKEIKVYNDDEEKYSSELHMFAVVDEKSNAVEVMCDNNSKVVEFSYTNDMLIKNDNLIEINLTKLFDIDMSRHQEYSFKVKSKFVTNDEKRYYFDSTLSEAVRFNVTTRLNAPIVSLNFNEQNDYFELNWEIENSDFQNIASYIAYVYNGSEVVTYTHDPNEFSMILPENFHSACVVSVGKGSFESSLSSNVVFNTRLSETLNISNCFISDGKVIWDNIENAMYIVEVERKLIVTNENQIDLSHLEIPYENLILTVLVQDKQPLKCVLPLTNYTKKLSTPQNVKNTGYVLTFDKVQNAYGYNVYLNDLKINKLFTTNEINLVQYITPKENEESYTVRVEAVANPYSIYINSDKSETITMTYEQNLEKVKFVSINGKETAIVERVENGITNYYLEFYGVNSAEYYEVLINFDSLPNVQHTSTGLYSINVTDYLTRASLYNIMVRAVPSNGEFLKPSEYAVKEYELIKQLDPVTNVRVSVKDSKYTLSFDLQLEAKGYEVKIIKVNDASYTDYLNMYSLENPFNTVGAVDISRYLEKAGQYYVYVKALAPDNSYYINSTESKSYDVIDKLSTLEKPKNLGFENVSKDEFNLVWNENLHADYYDVVVALPDGKEEKLTANTNKINVNSLITKEGNYSFKVRARITTGSENSVEYTNGQFSDSYTFAYLRVLHDTDTKDFERYVFKAFNTEQDFLIDNVAELKNVLWYHLVFDDATFRLCLNLENAVETLITEAKNNGMTISGNNVQDLFAGVINAYPEIGMVKDLKVAQIDGGNVYEINFKNLFNEDKNSSSINTGASWMDYSNNFEFVDVANRIENRMFNIDFMPEMKVETTEQLLYAVTYGYQPKFTQEDSLAEKVYLNARMALNAITTDNMSELEKTTRIFDYLEYAMNLNYFETGVLQSEENFGKRKEFYLEGLFENLVTNSSGDLVIKTSNTETNSVFASSDLYAKAFVLLCRIEGIEAVKVNGTYTVGTTQNVRHSWNKVNIKTSLDGEKSWYAVDLAFSDNSSYNSRYGYSLSSHLYYLTTDTLITSNLRTDLGSNETMSVKQDRNDFAKESCTTSFDYYSDQISNFVITSDQIKALGEYNDEFYNYEGGDLIYSSRYNKTETYYNYNYSGLGSAQKFILNALMDARNKLNGGATTAVVEIKLDSRQTNIYGILEWINSNCPPNRRMTIAVDKGKTMSDGYVSLLCVNFE